MTKKAQDILIVPGGIYSWPETDALFLLTCQTGVYRFVLLGGCFIGEFVDFTKNFPHPKIEMTEEELKANIAHFGYRLKYKNIFEIGKTKELVNDKS